MSNEKIIFAKDVSTEEIKKNIQKLSNHKVIREIDLLLKELKRRKEIFKLKILKEMMTEKDKEEYIIKLQNENRLLKFKIEKIEEVM